MTFNPRLSPAELDQLQALTLKPGFKETANFTAARFALPHPRHEYGDRLVAALLENSWDEDLATLAHALVMGL